MVAYMTLLLLSSALVAVAAPPPTKQSSQVPGWAYGYLEVSSAMLFQYRICNHTDGNFV